MGKVERPLGQECGERAGPAAKERQVTELEIIIPLHTRWYLFKK